MRHFVYAALPMGAVGLSAWAQPEIQARMVLHSETFLPGVPSGVGLEDIFDPKISDTGHVVALVLLDQSQPSGTRQIYYRQLTGESTQLVLREGDPVTGLQVTTSFRSVSFPLINSAGKIAFHSELVGSGVTPADDAALFSVSAPGELTLIARNGQQIPGLPEGVVMNDSDIFLTAWNDSDRIAFRSGISGPGVNSTNDQVLLGQNAAGERVLYAREGSSVPGLHPDITYRLFGLPVINNSGSIATFMRFNGTGVANNSAIGTDVGGNGFRSIIRTGDQAPGLSAGLTVSSMNAPVINERNELLIGSGLEGTGVTNDNNRILYKYSPAQGFLPLVRDGDLAPGRTMGETLHSIRFFSTSLNDNSYFVYGSGLNGNSYIESIFGGYGPDDMTEIASVNDHVPGFDRSVTFREFERFELNNLNQVAFHGSLSSGVDGIFAVDPEAGLMLIAVEGGTLNVSTDPLAPDLRTISELPLDFSSEEGFQLNNRGEIVFSARFTDGTRGIFVAQVPSPSSLILGIVAAAILNCRQSRRPQIA